jgi:sensor histidine kinase regulating citrate/malate metabolism
VLKEDVGFWMGVVSVPFSLTDTAQAVRIKLNRTTEIFFIFVLLLFLSFVQCNPCNSACKSQFKIANYSTQLCGLYCFIIVIKRVVLERWPLD